MSTKIVHISDLHHNRIDMGVSDRLRRALRDVAPDFLVISGDFADNPWQISAAKQWVLDTCNFVGIDANERLLVVPGNHDFRIAGNFGFKPLTQYWFKKHFDHYYRRVHFCPKANLTFICMDSNPICFGFARGSVRSAQLRRIGDCLNEDSRRERIAESLKIVVLHHHSLPVPYEAGWQDRFLVLEHLNNVLQFLADKNVALVLHGHNHMAPLSMVSLGTLQGTQRVVTVLGAGTAIAGGTDREARGHNFNVVSVEESGLIFIQQFFAAPGEEFRETPRPLTHYQSFDSLFARTASHIGYSYHTVHWDAILDEEGDTFNELTYTGLQQGPSAHIKSIDTPEYTVDTGHLTPPRLNLARTSEGVSLQCDIVEARRVRFRINLPEEPTSEHPLDYSLVSYDLNTISLTTREYRRKFPQRAVVREYEEIELPAPVEQLSWCLQFPPGYKPPHHPRFDVMDPSLERRHEWLTSALRPLFRYSENLNLCFIRVYKPPTNFRYRISWDLPEEVAIGLENPAHIAVVERGVKELLRLRELTIRGSVDDRTDQILQVLNSFRELVADKLEEISHAKGVLNRTNLEVSLMVYDEGAGADVPVLRVVASTSKDLLRSLGFSLEVGDGNAGRAFKTNTLRSFDASQAEQQPKQETYVHREGTSKHRFVYSLPLRHPESQEMIIAVLNVGSYEKREGDFLRLLQRDLEWLAEVGHAYVLIRLFETLKIELVEGRKWR